MLLPRLGRRRRAMNSPATVHAIASWRCCCRTPTAICCTPALETIDLDIRDILEAPNAPEFPRLFVESGLVSVVGAAGRGHHRIEIGMVGCTEGMTGLSMVPGDIRFAGRDPGASLGLGAADLLPARSLRRDAGRQPKKKRSFRQPAALLRQRLHGAGQPDGTRPTGAACSTSGSPAGCW